MRKRFQNGRVVKSSDGRYWIGKWLEDGRDRSKVLGKVAKMTKTKAREEMAKVVKPINERAANAIAPYVTVEDFVDKVYLPFYRRSWKRSTAMTNKDRIKHHIVSEFGSRELRTLTRDELQKFLEARASLSFSTTDHLRWDLKQMFDLAQADGIVAKHPALILFTPRECKRPDHPIHDNEGGARRTQVVRTERKTDREISCFGGYAPRRNLRIAPRPRW